MYSFPSDNKLEENKTELIERKSKLRVFCQGIRFKCYNKNVFFWRHLFLSAGCRHKHCEDGWSKRGFISNIEVTGVATCGSLKSPEALHPGAGDLPWSTLWIKHPIYRPQRTSGVRGEGIGSLAEGLSAGCFPCLFSTQWPVLCVLLLHYYKSGLSSMALNSHSGCFPFCSRVFQVFAYKQNVGLIL